MGLIEWWTGLPWWLRAGVAVVFLLLSTVLWLADRFWPGPLTLILKRSALAHDFITGGQDNVGVRVPSHPLAHRMLEMFGRGVAAPSAMTIPSRSAS